MHGTAGIWGVLAVLLSNEKATVGGQLLGLGCSFGFVFLASLLTWLALKVSAGIRVSTDQELEGVDLAECGIPAYPEFVSGSAVGDIGSAGGTPATARALETRESAA